MTNNGDVIRQIEILKTDYQYPLTRRQRETLDRILCIVASGTVEYEGSR